MFNLLGVLSSHVCHVRSEAAHKYVSTNKTTLRDSFSTPQMCIQSLLEPAFANKSFDLTTLPLGQGTPTTDFAALAATLEGKSCDYSINSQM